MKQLFLSFTFICLIVFTAFGQFPKPDTMRMSIFFDFGKYELRPESMKDIHAFSQKVQNQNAYKIYIQGNTDDKGSEEWNQTLSRNRCIAVENQLIIEGISQLSFEKVSALGEFSPIAENDNEFNRQKNRRVDVVVIYNIPKVVGIANITPWVEFSPANQAFIFKPLPVIAATLSIQQVTNTEETEDELEAGGIEEVQAVKEESLGDYLFSLSCKNQVHTLDGKVEHIITLAGGTQLYIPADAFEIEGSDKTFNLHIQEFTQKGNMILAGLNTQNDENILETGGMLNVEVTHKNNKVRLKKGKKLIGLFNAGKNRKEGMRLFTSFNLGKNWKVADSPELEAFHITTYHKEWGLPTASTESLQNLHQRYCEVCDEGIHFKKENEFVTKSFSIFGFSLFTFKSKVAKKEKATRWKRFVFSEQQRRKKLLDEDQFEDCPAMKAAIIEEIQKQAQFTDWYLNLFPNMKIYYELCLRIQKNKAKYYVINGIGLGWANCDRFAGYPQKELITLKINETPSENIIIRVAMKEDDVTLPSDAQIPKDKAIYIIAVKREKNQLYLSLRETQSDEETKQIVWEAVSEKELVRRINAINPS